MTSIMVVSGLLIPALSAYTNGNGASAVAVPANNPSGTEGESEGITLKDPDTGEEVDPNDVYLFDSDGSAVVYDPNTGTYTRERDGKVVSDPGSLKAFPKKITGTSFSKRPATVNEDSKPPKGRSLNAPVDSGSKPVSRPVYRPKVTKASPKKVEDGGTSNGSKASATAPKGKGTGENRGTESKNSTQPSKKPTTPPSVKPSTPPESPSETPKAKEPLVIEVNLTGGQDVIDECKGAVNYENFNHIAEHNYCGGDRYNSLAVGDLVTLKGSAITKPGTYVVKDVLESTAGTPVPKPNPYNLQTSVTDSIVRVWVLGEVDGK